MTTDVESNIQYGSRIYMPSNFSIQTSLESRSIDGMLLGTLTSSSYVFVGGDMAYDICDCVILNARVSVDYAPSTIDEMFNFAFLGLESKIYSVSLKDLTKQINLLGTLYIFQFVSSSAVNSNQTVPVEYYSTNSTQGNTTAYKGNNYSE